MHKCLHENLWKFLYSFEVFIYLGTVPEDKGGNYLVEDSVGNMEEISREDIITDDDDSPNSLKVRSFPRVLKAPSHSLIHTHRVGL